MKRVSWQIFLWGFSLVSITLCWGPSRARAEHRDPRRVSIQTPRVFATSTSQKEADLCAPCNDGSQCDSGLCAIASDGNGLCSQACSATTGCPANFTCTAVSSAVSLCYPNDDTVCPTPYLAPLNTFCQVPPTANNPNLSISRVCAAGLTCFVFPSGYGACVTACSSTSGDDTCAFGQKCCFGTDSNGYCQASTAAQSNGGCFTIAQFGASCAQPDHSFCKPGSSCLYGQTPAAAACYIGCQTGTCGAGGICEAFQGADVCCKSQLYNPDDATTCQPFAGVCRREVGVVCGSNDDCLSGLCFKNNTQAACSIPCTSDNDCPSAEVDVNGDGTADGGSTCQTFGSNQRCWPSLGPAKEPNCAIPSKIGTASSGQGCSCSTSPVGGFGTLGALVGLVVLRRKRQDRSSP